MLFPESCKISPTSISPPSQQCQADLGQLSAEIRLGLWAAQHPPTCPTPTWPRSSAPTPAAPAQPQPGTDPPLLHSEVSVRIFSFYFPVTFGSRAEVLAILTSCLHPFRHICYVSERSLCKAPGSSNVTFFRRAQMWVHESIRGDTPIETELLRHCIGQRSAHTSQPLTIPYL